MATTTTVSSATAWSPDVVAFTATDVIPDALILSCTTVVTGVINGDAPLVRVPYVSDDTAGFVTEGATITIADPTLAETVVPTAKLATVMVISSEQYRQQDTAAMLSESAQRSIITAADKAFLTQAAPTAPAVSPVAGLLVNSDILDGGAVAGDLDALVDLVAEIQGNGGQPTGIVLSPDAWGYLRKFKTGTSSNASLIGAGTEDAQLSLLGVPVAVSSAMTAGTGLVIDRTAIVSAVGDIEVATSDQAYFTSDAYAVRVAWRIGHSLMKADRVGKFTVTDPDA